MRTIQVQHRLCLHFTYPTLSITMLFFSCHSINFVFSICSWVAKMKRLDFYSQKSCFSMVNQIFHNLPLSFFSWTFHAAFFSCRFSMFPFSTHLISSSSFHLYLLSNYFLHLLLTFPHTQKYSCLFLLYSVPIHFLHPLISNSLPQVLNYGKLNI